MPTFFSILNEGNLAAAPLYGVDAQPEVNSIGPFRLVYLDLQSWSLIEKTGVTRDERLVQAYLRYPPVFLVLAPGGAIEGTEVNALETAARRLGDFACALRLHGDGTFVDPAYSGFYGRVSGWNTRKIGMYRQAFFGRRFDTPWKIGVAEIPSLEQEISRLERIRSKRGGEGLEFLLNTFRQGFPVPIEFREDKRFRIVNLFLFLEALFGRPTRLHHGQEFAARVAAASGWDGHDFNNTRAFISDVAIPERDRILHGQGASIDPTSDLPDQLLRVVRSVLRAYLRFLDGPALSREAASETHAAFSRACAAMVEAASYGR